MKMYHDLLADVLENGVEKGDRTGTGTISVFGRQFRHNLEDGFPLLTTKKLHFKSIINEMIWFLNGDTNTKWLKENGVKIWDEWATEDGDLGPVYGKQWTAWPTKDGKTINQIDYVVNTLKTNPNSRRILFHGWNVEYLPDESVSPQENARNGKMALPPCHLLYQFYVANNKLSTHLYIRSSDLLLGNPYNLAGASFLTHMLAQQCDMGVGEIIVTMGDAHIYLNHIEQVKLQLTREPRPLPKLVLKRKPASIYDYKFEDFEIVGYDPHPHISAPVSI
ncbi:MULTISPECIES: thymidylate synthase [Pseudomonas syringae group]|uniref:Thymidylate synthase n=1 Tax=Pseudomonas savastanoi pv. glycinea TaxID=318 RepID=A0A3M3FJN1_PSESG|nr:MULTISPECIES: thymidylate synthase [Pseudomonas syringae group]MBN4172922.1 Thymidylate synthase [Pseudomonas savastanoi pv. phaseolicola]MBS7422330.1 thymidylate synthase [Pseudomonas syringae]MDU8268957.1 thymidylate synthase [Pseudomonas syringae pv. actinidiae]MDU8285035.1 thymidylate synthase [Pseudomonas syringae pv. actinidiae]MDU8306286.1 thymidylate synthase [Pseudomonas syringae pv. actinidiae]